MMKHILPLCVSLLTASVLGEPLVWTSRAPLPGPGRHHPISFANETHAFYLTGSTAASSFTNDFYMYEEAKDEWIDLSVSSSAFPGKARSFGYGVVLNEAFNTRAYLGFGAAMDGERLSDWWEFDMATHTWTQLADFIGQGRRHPAMVPVRRNETHWEIHVGLGDGLSGNFNDWYSYDVSTNQWTQMPNFPSSKRHHPFHFGLGNMSYAGLGHSDGFNPYIERDWYHFDGNEWVREPDFASYSVAADGSREGPVSMEARVAGTEFSIELPLSKDDSTTGLSGSIGFVLSGDGDDHQTMETGEFHAFYAASNDGPSWWRALPPHPGPSRWAPGSFVMRGTARAYFTSGYNRIDQVLYGDLWMIDLSPLFSTPPAPAEGSDPTRAPVEPTPAPVQGSDPTSAPIDPTEEGESFDGETAQPITSLTTAPPTQQASTSGATKLFCTNWSIVCGTLILLKILR